MNELLKNLRIGKDQLLKTSSVVGQDPPGRRRRHISRMLQDNLSPDVKSLVGGTRLQRRSIDIQKDKYKKVKPDQTVT